MVIERRRFLSLVLGAAALSPLRLTRAAAGGGFLGCRKDAHGNHYATAVTGNGELLFDVALPERGHGGALRPGAGECVVFARRPGRAFTVIDIASGTSARRVSAPAERHFYGHGVFDIPGRLLYVTENAFETGGGAIGVYDAADGYRRLGELPSHGVGPHQIGLRRDGRTLVVANGGIRTHPDLGRSKLNLASMDPSLAYVDAGDGRLLQACRPPPRWHQLSIRHIDIAPDDTVCLAAQFEGPANLYPPLVAVHRDGESLEWLMAPQASYRAMHNYCGSVSFDADGKVIAVSAPRGNRVAFWSLRPRRWMGSLALADGCGVAPGVGPGEFVLSSGRQGVYRYKPAAAGPAAVAHAPARRIDGLPAQWDNHLWRLPA